MIPLLFYTFYFLSCILYVEKLSDFRNNWQLRKARKMFQKSENGLNWKKDFWSNLVKFSLNSWKYIFNLKFFNEAGMLNQGCGLVLMWSDYRSKLTFSEKILFYKSLIFGKHLLLVYCHHHSLIHCSHESYWFDFYYKLKIWSFLRK